MNNRPESTLDHEVVAIVGVGLIGGSLGAALKKRNVVRRVIGVGRDAVRLESARSAGLIDGISTDIAEAARRATLMVFCTPVDKVADGVQQAIAGRTAGSSDSDGKLGLLLTDAGSVKEPICRELSGVTNFIGGHPIAGSHKQGYEAADAGLFESKLCVLTPQANAVKEDIERLERLWKSVGMKTVSMTPESHDAALGMTSHLPHVVAAALAAILSTEHRPFVGSGFRDTTRVAAGDPSLWTGILLNNASSVLAGLDVIQHRLESFRTAISLGDESVLTQLLLEGQQSREAIEFNSKESNQ